jgi:predicted DNA-binding protein
MKRIGPGRMMQIGVTLRSDQFARLKVLSQETRVPVAEYVRQGVDAVLELRDKRQPKR